MEKKLYFIEMCWVCLDKQPKMHSICGSKVAIIMDKKRSDIGIDQVLLYITSEPIFYRDGPSCICKNCLQRACTAYVFKKRCEMSKAVFIESGLTSSCEVKSVNLDVNESRNNPKSFPLLNDEAKIEKGEIVMPDTTATVDEKLLQQIKKPITVFHPFSCPYCTKKFNQKNYIKLHIRRHGRGLPSICKICKDNFTSVASYEEHVKTHTNEADVSVAVEKTLEESEIIKQLTKEPPRSRNAPMPCKICGQIKSQSHMKQHLMIHANVRAYACMYCSKKFSDKSNLNVHIRMHTGNNPYKCSVCGKTFAHNTTYKVHLRVHDDVRPFKCHICTFSTRTHTRLNMHIKRHSGIKNHRCDQCDFSSCTKSELKDHIARHSNNKCFLCKVCGKGFTRARKLKDHEKSHTGVKNFFCGICNKGFTQRHSLRSHLRNIHSAILN